MDPATQANVNFAVAGTVTSVKAAVGQVVKAGAVLATLSPSTLQADVSQAQSALESAQSKLASDRIDQTLTSAQGSVTSADQSLGQDEVNVTDTDASNATALSQAEQAVAQAQSQLGNDKTTGPRPWPRRWPRWTTTRPRAPRAWTRPRRS